jgi:hypothetical protein
MADSTQDGKVNLDLKDLAVNESGQLHIANPELAEKLKASIANLPNAKAGAPDSNTYACGANIYACGKKAEAA